MDEVVGDQIKLKAFADYFLNEFSNSIEKNDRSERFQGVI